MQTSAAATPSSPHCGAIVGEGWGGGSGGGGAAVQHSSTPTPDPSPQGGGEGACRTVKVQTRYCTLAIIGEGGVRGNRRLNHLQYAFDIAQHFVVPETQHSIALSFNEPRPLSISRGLHMLEKFAAPPRRKLTPIRVGVGGRERRHSIATTS